MTVYAAEHPDLGIEFSSEPFIEMLASGGWTDLNKSSWMLVSMTRARDPVLLNELQEEALPALIDICRWELTGHAEAGCRILERILGLPEQEALHPKTATIAQAVELLPEGSPYRLP
jgi:hypothetical protein